MDIQLDNLQEHISDETHVAAMGIATAMDVISQQASDIMALCQDVREAESHNENLRELLLEALRVTPQPHKAGIERQLDLLRRQ